MRIKYIFIIMIFSLNFLVLKVKASDNFYVNENGVFLNEEEYNYISKIYWNGFQDKMDINDYNFIFENGLPYDVESVVEEPLILFSSGHTTKSKSLKISKVNYGNYYLITTVASWLVSPKVRSYDVIGVYLEKVKLIDEVETLLIFDGGKINSDEVKKDSSGFGVSIKLPVNGNSIKVTQTFKVSGSGHIYASYQHAKKNISLLNSKKYTISKNGYGGVFQFESGIRDYYDAMQGVDISI